MRLAYFIPFYALVAFAHESAHDIASAKKGSLRCLDATKKIQDLKCSFRSLDIPNVTKDTLVSDSLKFCSMPLCNQENVNKLAEEYAEACLAPQPKTQTHKSLGFAYLYTPIVEAVCIRDEDGEFTLANVQKSYRETGVVNCRKGFKRMVETVNDYNVKNKLEGKTVSFFSFLRDHLTEQCGQKFMDKMDSSLRDRYKKHSEGASFKPPTKPDPIERVTKPEGASFKPATKPDPIERVTKPEGGSFKPPTKPDSSEPPTKPDSTEPASKQDPSEPIKKQTGSSANHVFPGSCFVLFLATLAICI